MDEALKDYGVEILKLRDGFFRSLEQGLHFFDRDIRCRIVLMPYHLLHACGIGVIEQRKGGDRVPQTMDHHAGFLHSRQEQAFGAEWPLTDLRTLSALASGASFFTPTSRQDE